MSMSRREFLHMLSVGAGGIAVSGRGFAGPQDQGRLYDLAPFGNLSLLHFTDTHAQLLPTYFREPSVNLGVGAAQGKPPHLVGDAFLRMFHVQRRSLEIGRAHV